MPFQFLSKDEQAAGFSKLIEAYKNMSDHMVLSNPWSEIFTAERLDKIINETEGMALSLLYRNRFAEILELLQQSPAIPGHGDLHGRNIIQKQHDLRYIDLEYFKIYPFFLDIFILASYRKGGALLTKDLGNDNLFEALMYSNQFDAELDDLTRRYESGKIFSTNKADYVARRNRWVFANRLV